MSRRLLALAAVLAATAALCVPAASASRFIEHGIFDDAQIHYGNPDVVFPMLKQLRSELLRINLQWGGPNAVARRRPARPTDPEDPAYNWAEYDRTVNFAQQYGQKVVFAIIGTPPWANKNKGLNVAPTNPADLQRFAAAAATRYSGTYEAPDGRILPPVLRWLAWNEPNNPAFLRPQYKKVNGKQTIQSAKDYAKICNAVVKGIRVTRVGAAKVACGVTSPRGNNNPNTSRPSVAPLPFLRAMKAAGATGFSAYAHHPYYGKPLGDAVDAAAARLARPAVHRGHAREHQHTHRRGDAPLRTQAHLDLRVRLPDEAARPDLRRVPREPGEVPDAGLRHRPTASPDRHVPLVPAQG